MYVPHSLWATNAVFWNSLKNINIFDYFLFTFIKAGFSRKKIIKYLNFRPWQIIKFFCLVLQNGFIMIQRYSLKSFFHKGIFIRGGGAWRIYISNLNFCEMALIFNTWYLLGLVLNWEINIWSLELNIPARTIITGYSKSDDLHKIERDKNLIPSRFTTEMLWALNN